MNRPFDRVAEAQERWQSGDSSGAEEAFIEGIKAYERFEPDGVAFALGRYGSFLLGMDRGQEAQTVLERAIALGTDIPVIWRDYALILLERGDVDSLLVTAQLMSASVRDPRAAAALLLMLAGRALREHRPDLARVLLERTLADSLVLFDQDSSWVARGLIGKAIEDEGRPDDAVSYWARAFSEGSNDGLTANRLSMLLQKNKRYQQAAQVLEDALSRSLPANVEERLRKRLVRVQDEVLPKSERRKTDVPSYSIRDATVPIEEVFQVRLRPPIRRFDLWGDLVRCFGLAKDQGSVFDVVLEDGSVVRELRGLPAWDELIFSPPRAALGVERFGTLGKGRATLSFLNAEFDVLGQATLPDAVSEAAVAGEQWAVGCRDGNLYAYSLDGQQLWSWSTPGSEEPVESPGFRPCPYYVTAIDDLVVTSSMGRIFAVGPAGDLRWTHEIPTMAPRRVAHTVQVEGEDIDLAIEFGTMEPWVSSLATRGVSVLVGSNDGRLHQYAASGTLEQTFQVGDASTICAVNPGSDQFAAWSNGQLLLPGVGESFAWAKDPPSCVSPGESLVALARRNRLDLLNATGAPLGTVEFAKRISGVRLRGNRVVCGAGTLVALDVTSEGAPA